MRKKQHYNPLQLSLFDNYEASLPKETGPKTELDKQWDALINETANEPHKAAANHSPGRQFSKQGQYLMDSGLGGSYDLKFINFDQQEGIYSFRVTNPDHKHTVTFTEDTIQNVRENPTSPIKTLNNNNLNLNNDERDIQESNVNNRATIHDGGERGHGTPIGTVVEGQADIRPDQSAAAGTLRGDEAGKDLNTLPSGDHTPVVPQHETTPTERPETVRGGRDRVEEPVIGSRSGITDFEQAFDVSLDQIKEITEKDRLENPFLQPDINWQLTARLGNSLGANGLSETFSYKDKPPLASVIKDTLDLYKTIAASPKYINGGYYEQKLHNIATKIITQAGLEISANKAVEAPKHKVSNYHSTTSPSDSTSFNKKAKYGDNIAALDVLLTLKAERRPASPEEQTTLAKYVGWGGLKEILLDPDKDADWKTASDIALRPLVKQAYERIDRLDPDGSLQLLDAAKRSILNAHYTSYEIINAVYQGVEKAGFKGGNVLEPSAGIGNFLAAMPEDMANNSDVTAIEMDKLTGQILQRLFPTAQTHITGLEKISLPANHYDLIVSNIPFGDVAIADPQLLKFGDKRFAEASNNTHNYFFAKAIHLAKPDSMIAFITSRYTLDSNSNQELKDLMNDTCKFLGAVRLPDTAFKSNAGTEVVSDIIFLKKFGIGEEKVQDNNFMRVKATPFTDHNGQSGLISYNEYFHDHPSHMIGTVEYGGLYRKDEFNLKGDKNDNLLDKINDITDQIFEKPVLSKNVSTGSSIDKREAEIERYIKMKQYDSIGNIVVLQDGFAGVISDQFHINNALDERAKELGISPDKIRNSRGDLQDYEIDALERNGITLDDFSLRVVEPLKVKKADLPKAKYIHTMRERLKELLFLEMSNYPDERIENVRQQLNQTYKEFTDKYGNINSKENDKILELDSDNFVIDALEVQDKLTGKITPADILTKRTIKPASQVTSVDNIPDALSLSFQKHGKVHMNYIAELMDKTYDEIMDSQQQGGTVYIFKDGDNNHLSREEYLSGNVVEKLQEARLLAENDPDFEVNVRELEKVQPAPIEAVDIYSPLHARWIDKKYIHEFLKDLLDTDHIDLKFSPSADEYKIHVRGTSGRIDNYASKIKKAEWVINHALNGIEPKVTYTERDHDGKERVVFDAEDTQLAKDNYNKIRDAWNDWKYQNFERREDIARTYNQKFNTTVLRNWDGSHMTTPGIVGYELRPHQKDCVFRNVQQLGGINDHMVGAGKTLVQIATAMELRRLGMANKPLIIGLKSQIPQLYQQFKQAYPLSKVLFPSEKDFQKDNRKRLLNNIATNDWDCIILSHDQFNRIKQPAEIEIKLIEELAAVLKDEIYMTEDKQEKKRLEGRLYKHEQKITELRNTPKDEGVLDFSQLGIDFLMVDESQEFKNLEFSTTKKNVKGLGNPMGSKKAFNMLIAARHLQNMHGGDKGVLFSSGTPISNTMAELYLLFKFLRPNAMEKAGLTSFDRWAANFANDFSDLEYYMGRFKEVHRFREFVNLPELLTMYREIADVRNNHNLTLDKPQAEHILEKIQPSAFQLQLIEKLQGYINTKGVQHADELGLTAGFDERKGVNPSYGILAVNFAKKLSLDPRLINPNFPAGAKLEATANRIVKTYNDTTDYRGTQLVFCDIGTPKSSNKVDNLYDFLSGDTPQSDLNDIFGENYTERKTRPKVEDIKRRVGSVLQLTNQEVEDLFEEANTAQTFNVYDETKRLLIKNGIPANEIAFIHDYKTRKAKDDLYEKVNDGEIRVLLGSTKKLGTGVNVQKRAVAGHNLDITWRPSDMEQRTGRFERQGNEVAKNFLGNKVKAYYYATERTLDASMYNTVSLKAKFIAQLKAVGNVDVRTVKDIQEDVDMGSMAAELSGDPIFKEKADLTKRINELEQMEKGFNSKKWSTEGKLRNATTLVDHYEQKIPALKSMLPYLDRIPKSPEGDPVFKASINGKHFEKVGEYGMALLTELEAAKKYKPVGSFVDLGEVWGFKIKGRIAHNFQMENKEVERIILAPDGETSVTSENKMFKTDNNVATATQIKQAILAIPRELDRITLNREQEMKNKEEYTTQLDAVFPYKDEIAEKQQRMAEINEIIKAKAGEIEQKQKSQEVNENEGQEIKLEERPDVETDREERRSYGWRR